MNWRGTPVRLQQVDSQIAIPVVLSSKGYGLFWNNAARTDFNPTDCIERPAIELKGFQKVRLQPGETRRVTLTLNDRAFSYWDVQQHGWRIDPGLFKIYVGDSSENLPLTGSLTLP